VTDIICNDNGTPTNPGDDTYTFKVTVFKSGFCASTTWSGGGKTGGYGTAVTYGPYPISGGSKTFVITNLDGAGTTVTAVAPAPCSITNPAKVGDMVWIDLNSNGLMDLGEPGQPGMIVKLYLCNGTYVDQRITDANGKYHFLSLIPNQDYYIEFSGVPAGYMFTSQDAGNDSFDSDANPTTGRTACFPLFPGQDDPTRDAGIKLVVQQKAKIGDFVWLDTNSNGIQDPGEPGIPNLFVILETCAGAYVNYAITDATGKYLFDNVAPGSYRVKFANPGTYGGQDIEMTIKNAGSDAAKDNNANNLGYTDCFTIAQGETNLTIDGGFKYKTPPQVCTLRGVVSNIICDDKGTASTADDTYTFTLVVTGTNTGAWGYDIVALNKYMLVFGQSYILGPFLIGQNQTLIIKDHDVNDCTTTVTVTSPPPCSPVDPCANRGGDADRDGVCKFDDCDDNNPAIGAKKTPGTACNDGNPNTTNDVIQADGCTCAGTPVCNIPATFSVAGGCLSQSFLIFADANDPYFPPINPKYIYSYDIQPANTVASIFTIDPRSVTVTFNAAGVKTATVTITDRANPNCQVVKQTTFTVTDCGACATRGGDFDNDGVCKIDDCDDTNPAIGARKTPGTTCNDGNPNTTNDVIQSDGCTCAGTPVTPGCNAIVSVSGNTVNITGLTDPVVSVVIYTSTYTKVFECNSWASPCGASVSHTINTAGTYFVQVQTYNASWTTKYCDIFQTIQIGGGCVDNDRDGVCVPNDCDDNNASVGAKKPAGTACNDGNPNTTNDVILADGCTCAGTPINTCDRLTSGGQIGSAQTGCGPFDPAPINCQAEALVPSNTCG
jgi:hypothetical protein